jgi:hypothetical protein
MNMRHGPRDERGWLLPIDALERFRAKCSFDARTGCVIWTGGRTQGRGNSAVYGSFWYDNRRWFAHRWAAVHIHGLDVDGLQVGHCCPHTPDGHPNTLCVQHVTGQSQRDNLAEQHERRARMRQVEQSPEARQYWLLVERGYEPPPAAHDPATIGPDHIPFFEPPAWLQGNAPASAPDDCPF